MNCPSCGAENPAEASFCMSCGTIMVPPTESTSSSPSEMGTSSDFVGRHREMADLKAALEDAISGHGRLVMLAGEPGIGKTRTAQELASAAESRGAQVLWGRCYEEEGTPPYWPWLQSLRSYIQQQTPEQLQAEMGPGAADIAEILSEVREKLPDLEPPPTLEPEQARFRLFKSITNFLQNAAQSQPLMLVLDDLHWADRSSLLLLEFIAREIQSSPLLVLGTYRDVEVHRRHPLSETLGSLMREQGFLRVQLTGLAEGEVDQLIRKTGSDSLSPELSAAIHQRTEGNPLFVSEIIRMLPNDAIEEGRDYLTSIPEGVRDAIGQRLNRLSEGCNQVLTTASVIGREFDFRLTSALMDNHTEASLLGLIDEALEAHVIEELPEGRERYQFSHALVQETLAGELSASRKVRLHARIAEALETLYGSGAETHASELAFHFAEAESVVGPKKLVHYSWLAGEQALAAYAWQEALVHLERALEAKGLGPESIGTGQQLDEESAAVFLVLGHAQIALNLSAKAVSSLHRSFDYYVQASNLSKAVEIAEYGHSLHLIYGMRDVMARALELVEPDSHEAGRVLANYGFALGQEGKYNEALAMFDRALSISRRENDQALEARTLANQGNIHGFYHRWKESHEANSRAIELTADIDQPQHRHRALLWNSYALTSLGRPEEAALRAAEGLDLAKRFNDQVWFPRCLRALLIPYIAKGDWPSVEQTCEKFQSEASKPYRIYLGFQRGYSEHDSEIRSLQETAKTVDGRIELLILGIIAHVSGNAELLAIAESSALFFSQLRSNRVWPAFESCVAGCVGFIAASRQDVSVAQELYPILLSQLGQWSWLYSTDRLRGLLAQTIGENEQAISHFEDALTFCREAQYRPELAWTCHDYAETLLRRDAKGDGEQATMLLEEAFSVSKELGMSPLFERVLTLQCRVERQPRQVPDYPDGLTPREAEVLRLVAGGKTDRQVAEQLVIAEGTVRRHISNIYSKTGVSNRSEATRYALLEQLLPLEESPPQ